MAIYTFLTSFLAMKLIKENTQEDEKIISSKKLFKMIPKIILDNDWVKFLGLIIFNRLSQSFLEQQMSLRLLDFKTSLNTSIMGQINSYLVPLN